jgi:hypothetical protein
MPFAGTDPHSTPSARLAASMPTAVASLAVNGSAIYVGGQFGLAGGPVSADVARFSPDEIFAGNFQ